MDPNQPATQLTDPMDGMDEVIKEFLIESNEGLDRFDRDLIALEKDKTSRELLDSIFRAVHTIKGTGGVLGYEKLVSISHLGESVLSRMRDGVLLLAPEIATALLAMADSLRCILEQIAENGKEGDGDCSAVLQQLSAVLNDPPLVSPPARTEAISNAQSGNQDACCRASAGRDSGHLASMQSGRCGCGGRTTAGGRPATAGRDSGGQPRRRAGGNRRCAEGANRAP